MRLPWKQSLPWNFSLYWNIFIIQDFWATSACPEKQSCPEIFHCIEYTFTFRSFEQPALALKNRGCPEFTVLNMHFYRSGFLSNLHLPWKNRVCPEIFQARCAAALPRPHLVCLCLWDGFRPRPPHAIRKGKSVLLLHFRQEDISQNLAETSWSPWLWESDCYANNFCWGRTGLQII